MVLIRNKNTIKSETRRDGKEKKKKKTKTYNHRNRLAFDEKSLTRCILLQCKIKLLKLKIEDFLPNTTLPYTKKNR